MPTDNDRRPAPRRSPDAQEDEGEVPDNILRFPTPPRKPEGPPPPAAA